MAKRGYKLQEFVAHSANVNCVKIGKKAGRLLITGGDDNKVNLWSIGKPTSLMSLCGHTTPIESVGFDSSEVLVVAGASTGAIKLWDLEEAKIVRTLTGHRSYCTAVEFHPFGEFFASGSMDTNLKIWDIRKKGCIHTYKGHTRGISNIRFSPDGRWVVSGGLDNVVKVWDLTAGKLLHDFKFHEGHIRSIDFHPLEFLLATGSADRTVKFWDLETFELIGSTRPETAGVRAVTFHPDGKTLLCGLDDNLKVYSWEPVICHDAIDMGWSTLGDLCTHEGKLLGSSYYQNSVGVWIADIKLIDQYGSGLVLEESASGDQKYDIQGSHSLEKAGDSFRSTMGLHCMSPECEPKDIKTIYVDSSGENCVTPLKVGSFKSPEAVFPLESIETSDLTTQKHVPQAVMHTKTNGQAPSSTLIIPNIVFRESTDAKDLSNPKREPEAAVERRSYNKCDIEKTSVNVECVSLTNMVTVKESPADANFHPTLEVNDEAKELSEDKHSNIKSVVEKFDKVLSPQTPSNPRKASDESPMPSKEISTVKFVNGVAVIQGRTRSLVERFERRDSVTPEDKATNISVTMTPEIVKPQTDDTPPMQIGEAQISEREPTYTNNQREPQFSETETTSANDQREPQISETGPTFANDQIEPQITKMEPNSANDQRREPQTSEREQASAEDQRELQISQTELTSANDQRGKRRMFGRVQASANDQRGPRIFGREPVSASVQRGPRIFGREPASANDQRRVPRISRREPISANDQRELRISRRASTLTSTNDQRGPRSFVREPTSANDQIREGQIFERELTSARNQIREGQISGKELTSADDQIRERQMSEREHLTSANDQRGEPEISGRESTSTHDLSREFQISEREPTSANDPNLIEDLLQSHDVFLSTLRSRLTKLQVVRHFWERRDFKGAVNGLRKLPDHSVQADVVSVLMEKMEILTLDLFSHLLPVLAGLLDSKTERHANISLEMLLKLVAVFGSVISSTVSAPPAVGVDLQAEQRLECCKQCFVQLQKIQRILPLFIRRGGLLARCSRELNLVLQQL